MKENFRKAQDARRRRYDIAGRIYVRVQPIQKRMKRGDWYWLCKPEEGRGERIWLDQEGTQIFQ